MGISICVYIGQDGLTHKVKCVIYTVIHVKKWQVNTHI